MSCSGFNMSGTVDTNKVLGNPILEGKTNRTQVPTTNKNVCHTDNELGSKLPVQDITHKQ